MPQKTYRVSPWRLWLLPGVFVGLAAVVWVAGLLAQDSSDGRAAQVTGIILVIIGGTAMPLVWYPRLVVSAEGIAQRQVGWHVSTTWDNVERLETKPGHQGLYLRRPLTGGTRALRVGRYLPAWYSEEQYRKAGEDRWFPLQPFAWWLRHGDLQQEIARRAPQLFDPTHS